MLDRPISQADIDNRTVFRTRGGSMLSIEGPSKYFPGLFKVSNGLNYDPNGVWRDDKRASPYDLISRVEEPIEPQVVVEDRRTDGNLYGWKQLTELPGYCIFESQYSPGCVRIACDNRHAHLVINGTDHIAIVNSSGFDKCRELSGVRLRLVLEQRD